MTAAKHSYRQGMEGYTMRNTNPLRVVLVAIALAVSLPACAPMAGRETPGEYIDDAAITTKVKASIIDDLGLKQIGVETMQNVVQLSGFVDSPQIKARAGDIARGIPGVKEVKNNLVVR